MGKIIKEKFCCKRVDYRIAGIVLRPNKNLPIAILSHGFLANSKMMSQYMRLFAELGYAAFSFDFVGGCIKGKSDGKLTDMSVLTEVEDLKAVIEFAKSQTYVNPENICLMGCSQGGVVSALCAAELKEQIEKLILFYTAFCIPDDAKSGKMIMFNFNPDNIPDIIKCKIPCVKISKKYPEAVIDMDIWEEISGYKGNVLIVHGTRDKIVKPSYAEKAKIEYDVSGANCKLVMIEGGGHFFRGKYDKTAMRILHEFCNHKS